MILHRPLCLLPLLAHRLCLTHALGPSVAFGASAALGAQQQLREDLSTASSQFSQLPTFSGNMSKAPAIAVSHGGGPMPILNDPSHKSIIESLRNRVPKIMGLDQTPLPKAIVVVTAHWSEREPTISSGASHDLYYDYSGFPPETYKLKYPAPGSPEVAKEVAEVLTEAGFKPVLDDKRGWDHGVFVPLMLIEPEARIPVVQVSVLRDEDPKRHFEMGKALGKLREKGVVILGSGFASFHNLRLMFAGVMNDPEFKGKNDAWSKAVGEAVAEEGLEEREKRLEGWRAFPEAYSMHPRGGAEHFLPLIVCAGAGGEGQVKSYSDAFYGLEMFSYYWT